MGPNLKEIAQRIAEWHIVDAEYCLVYEDKEVIDLDLSEEEMQEIHRLITRAKVTIE